MGRFTKLLSVVFASTLLLTLPFLSTTALGQKSEFAPNRLIFENGSGWTANDTTPNHFQIASNRLMTASGNIVDTLIQEFQDRMDEIMVGLIVPFLVAPTINQWLKCDGTTYNITDHQDLYNKIGNMWGGDGITEFRVPDLQGYFLRGSGDMFGNSTLLAGSGGSAGPAVAQAFAASASGTTWSGNTPALTTLSHTHAYVDYINGASGGSAFTFNEDGGTDNDNTSSTRRTNQTTFSAGSHNDHSVTAFTITTADDETRPRNFTIDWYIRR